MNVFNQFISGGIMVAFLTISLFFYRFWKKTSDNLFAVFAAAFSILAVERVLLLLTNSQFRPTTVDEMRPYIYLVRFSAFMLIIVAFISKNRRASN